MIHYLSFHFFLFAVLFLPFSKKHEILLWHAELRETAIILWRAQDLLNGFLIWVWQGV